MGFMVLFTVTALRAYFLQVLKSGELTEIIRSQYMTSVELMPYRGTVYDRNGAELAASLDVESLYARPALVHDPQAAAKLIAPILELPTQAVYRDLASPKPFVWLQRKVSPTQADKIRALKIDGVGFLKESQRFYPQKELAAQVLGFVGVDSQGLEGIERQYDSIIKGKSISFLPTAMQRAGMFLLRASSHRIRAGRAMTWFCLLTKTYSISPKKSCRPPWRCRRPKAEPQSSWIP